MEGNGRKRVRVRGGHGVRRRGGRCKTRGGRLGVGIERTSVSDPHVEYGETDASTSFGTPHSTSMQLEDTAQISISSSSSVGKRLRHDEDINHLFHYGSEDDSDNEEDEENEDFMGLVPVFVPRAARVFLSGEEEDEVQLAAPFCDVPTFAWVPQELIIAPQPEVQHENVMPELQYYPTSKFEFNWRPFPDSQIHPDLRREPFSNINCGPTVPLASPYEAFTAIWDREIMEHIASETNRYAQQVAVEMFTDGSMRPTSRITKWRDTDASELYVHFAIIIAMGVVVKTNIQEYWNTSKDIFSTPGFAVAMGIDRFLLLNKCLHFANNNDCDPNTMTRSEAKLFKIKPVLDHLNYKFQTLYSLTQNIALDESLTMWKGWLDINQFIRNKVATVGIKTYEVCESNTGYLWRFEVHAGHDITSEQQYPLSGTIPALVLRLLNGLEHKGHTIWMDNFYNSPSLARELKVRGFDCVGTLRTNRQFVPEDLASLTKQNMAIGQMSGCTSGDVDIVVWRDKNRVGLISTYHGLTTVNSGDTLKPSIIPEYNVCMGGVDRKDQMLAMFPIERKRCRVWYKKLFRRLLNVSVLNSFRLLTTEQPISHRKYRLNLVNQLLRHVEVKRPPETAVVVGHFPALFEFVASKKHERLRRLCKLCNKRTTAYCRTCNVALCPFTCFEPYHT